MFYVGLKLNDLKKGMTGVTMFFSSQTQYLSQFFYFQPGGTHFSQLPTPTNLMSLHFHSDLTINNR